jgi:hypothetical protein
MKYVFCPIAGAREAGISVRNHRTADSFVVLNEREVMTASIPGSTLEERADHLGGDVYPIATIKQLLDNYE